MTKLLLKAPWFISAPAVVLLAGVLAYAGYFFAGDYFERTFLDEGGFVFERPDTVAAGDDTSSGEPPESSDGGDTQNSPDGGNAGETPAAEGSSPAEPTEEPQQASVVATGEFEDGVPGHNGEGQAYLLTTEDGELVLRFENFSVTNGPDLHVVLSKETGGGGYGGGLDLGGLKATDGNFNYTIPAGTDLVEYNSVIIWCEPFSILFAFADFER